MIIAFLPNDLPDQKWQAVTQHLDDHIGVELETSSVYLNTAVAFKLGVT